MIFPRLPLALVLLLPLSGYGQDETGAPARLNLAEFPGAMVEKIVVPVPAEVFAVLDKLDESDWSSEIRLPDSAPSGSDRVRLALIFGSTVAEAFIAVQAEDGPRVQDIGRRVLSLAESLGLQTAVVPHSQSIINGAARGDWRKVREELDKTQQTVRTEMKQLRDDDLATLVSLGGWLRGTEALTSLISQSYSTDKAELLNQPDLIRHFHEGVGEMEAPVRKQPDVAEIATGLEAILAALSENDTGAIEIPANTVLRVGEICGALLGRFYFEEENDARETDRN